MSEQFRTTVSLVFWTDTTGASDSKVNDIKAILTEEEQKAVLASVEYISEGKPDPNPPVPVE